MIVFAIRCIIRVEITTEVVMEIVEGVVALGLLVGLVGFAVAVPWIGVPVLVVVLITEG